MRRVKGPTERLLNGVLAPPDVILRKTTAGQEFTWTMDLEKLERAAGPAKLRLTLHWYGGPSSVAATLQKMSGTVDQDLSVAAAAGCFVAKVVAEKPR